MNTVRRLPFIVGIACTHPSFGGRQDGMGELDFVLRFDPGPYPLVTGLELSVLEVVWGLRLGSFNPGTRLYDLSAGRLYTVRQVDGRLALEPACERIENYAKRGHSEDRQE